MAGWRILAAGSTLLALTACAVPVDAGRGTPDPDLTTASLAAPLPPKAKQTPTPKPTPAPRKPSNPASNVVAAANYAKAHGVRTGIAVLDRKTNQFYGGGDYDGLFGSASVMKVLVATRLLATGKMTGSTETTATEMIERSDDDAVRILWPQAGGPGVLPWVADHYDIDGLGTPNTRPGVWGNTHITAAGMVRLYRAIAADPVVGPWLLDAMHHVSRIAADGTDQSFGLPMAAPKAAIKQGWGVRSADEPGKAIVNSTGYVEDDRYAVAILGEGAGTGTDAAGYNARVAAVVTHVARLLLPHGTVR